MEWFAGAPKVSERPWADRPILSIGLELRGAYGMG